VIAGTVVVVDVVDEFVLDGFGAMLEEDGVETLVALGIESVNGRVADDPPHAVVRTITLSSDGPSRRDDPTPLTLP
jgi:hypothetical protein